jgi:iron complex transport system substrate-binding protein
MNPASCIRSYSCLLISVATVLPGCRRDPAENAPPAKVTAQAPVQEKTGSLATWPVEVVDSLDRRVSVVRPPERIVSLAPSNTEILFAVGAGRLAVGRTSYDNYPPEARSRASIGGMTPKTINLEAVIALRPDLILATSGIQEPIIASLERLKLVVVAIDATDFAGVARNIRLVGRLTGNTANADRLASEFLDRVAAVGRRVATRRSPRPKVLYVLHEDPLMTAGPATFIGQMIETAGGINVFGDVTARYPRPSEEEILARAPEVILATYGDMNAGGPDDEARRQRIRARGGWAQVPAVRDNRIAFLNEDLLSRPGPRLVDGLEAVAKVLEVDVPDPREETGPAKNPAPH